jgi:hypothetical protein
MRRPTPDIRLATYMDMRDLVPAQHDGKQAGYLTSLHLAHRKPRLAGGQYAAFMLTVERLADDLVGCAG